MTAQTVDLLVPEIGYWVLIDWVPDSVLQGEADNFAEVVFRKLHLALEDRYEV